MTFARPLLGLCLLSSLATGAAFAGCASNPDSESVGVGQQALDTPDACAAPDGGDEASASIDGSACLHVELVAVRSYVTGTSTDAEQLLPHPMKFALPRTVPVTAGNAGNYALMVEWTNGDAGLVTCTYQGGATTGHPTDPQDIANGRAYVFSSCDDGTLAGDRVTATDLILHIEGGDDQDPAQATVAKLVVDETGCAPADAGADAAKDGGAPDAPETGMDAAPESGPDAAADAPTCTAASCDDKNPCTTDTCRADGTCSHTAVAAGAGCGDNSNLCVGAFTCNASAQCVQGAPPPIDTSNPCRVGRCDPATGVTYANASSGTVCGDNSNRCVGASACNGAGACVQGAPPPIDTSNPCRVGRCDPATGVTYTNASSGTVCGDNSNRCAGASACNGAGACVQSPPPPIDTSNPCRIGRCDPATGISYSPAPTGTTCGTNANRCVGALACDGAGTCVQGPPPPIDTSNRCLIGSCDPATGVHYTPAAAGTACGDNSNKCVGAFLCTSVGTCVEGSPPPITPPNRCYTGTCDSATGVVYTPIPGCDPSPTDTGNDYETRASLVGHVVTSGGAPFTAFTVAVFDAPAPPGATPRSDVSFATASDGSFRARLTAFPESEPERTAPHHLIVRIQSPNTIPATRDAYLHPGGVIDFGQIVVVPRDGTVTTIDVGGGVAIDSQGLVEVRFPPNAVSGPTPVRITPFRKREELPLPLPDSTITTYAIALEPEGLTFPANAQPTVRLANYRNLPTTFKIPVGVANHAEARWEHEGFATWDGQRFAFTVPHFSDRDINNSLIGQWLARFGINDKTKGKRNCGVGSSVALGNGGLGQQFSLPTYRRMDRAYGVTFNYDSFLTFGSTASGGGGGGLPPLSGIVVNSARAGASMECLARPQFDQISSTTPGSCGGGACTPGMTMLPKGLTLQLLTNGQSTSMALDGGPGVADAWMDVTVNLPKDGNGNLPTPYFVQTTMTLLGSGSACAGNGGAFGSGTTTSPGVEITSDPQPIATEETYIFTGHRHGSPYGTGWAIEGIGRLFRNHNAYEAVLLSGSNAQERFSPRPSTRLVNADRGVARALARDGTTVFVADDSGISQLDVASGVRTPFLTGIAFGSAPIAMAITYVSGVRHFVVATDQQLVDVDAGGALRALMSRGFVSANQGVFAWTAPGLAARDGIAYYTNGYAPTPVLYRFDLSAASPQPVALSPAVGGDQTLDPHATLSGVHFGDPRGLAFNQAGDLYVADRMRNVVYLVKRNVSGAIAGDSTLVRMVGDGVGRTLAGLGRAKVGSKFSISQPILLSMSADDRLWMVNGHGAALFDTQTNEAMWLVHDAAIPDSELNFTLLGNHFSSILATGPLSFLVNDNVTSEVTITPHSSDDDPTRTLTFTPSGATLTDATGDVQETYDAHGRLVDRHLRTGDPILTVGYADATSERIAQITDPTGSATLFNYVGGKLFSITDPASRATVFTLDGNGDLTRLTLPDGEAYTFAYAAHRMTSKRSPKGDVTSYTYAPDGTVKTSTKPAGEVFTLTAAFGQKPVRDVAGKTAYGGSFIDAHGVPHAVVLDQKGFADTDTYTADGTSYVVKSVKPAILGENDDLHAQRRNAMLRVGYQTINGLAAEIETVFDSLGRVAATSQRKPGSPYLDTFTYDANGRVSGSYSSPGNNSFAVSRDPVGRLAAIREMSVNGTVPTGRQSSYTWRPDGLVGTSTTHGVTTTYGYDAAVNVSSTSDTLGRTSATTYDASGAANVAAFFDGLVRTSFAYDANNRLVSSTDALGNLTTMSYVQASCGCTESSLVTSIHTPDLPANLNWRMGYGPEGRLTSVTDPDNHTQSFDYERTGELKSVTDALARTTTMSHDQLGRVKSMVDALGRAHARSYPVPTAAGWAGPNGLSGSGTATPATTDIAAATLNAGDYQVGTNGYDAFGIGNNQVRSRGFAQVSFYRDATFALSYGHGRDEAGRLTRRDDRAGQPIASTQAFPPGSGALDQRLTGYSANLPGAVPVSEANDSGTSNFTYSPEYDVMSSIGFGGLGGVTLANLGYTRDVAGRVAQIAHHYTYTDVFDGPLINYTYQPDGRVASAIATASHPSGPTYPYVPDGGHTYTYDARGLVRSINRATYSYDAAGRNTTLDMGAIVRVQQFDNEGRITSRCYNGSNGLNRCYTATYDAVGNPVSLTDPEGSDVVTYDALDRITSVTRNGQLIERYDYNSLGALKTNGTVALDHQRPSLASPGVLADAAVPSSYQGAAVSLDAGGRITSFSGMTLTYDKRGQVVSNAGLASGAPTKDTYAFDAYGRRSATHRSDSSANTTDEYYFYDGANIVQQWVIDSRDFGHQLRNAHVINYVYEGVDKPLFGSEFLGAQFAYELDLAGNVRRLRHPGDGSDLGGYRYTAFGKQYPPDAGTPTPSYPNKSILQALRWKGRPFIDMGAGLYDMRARFWSPELGAFTSVDEFLYHDDTSTLWAWPGQNPLRWSDQSGHFATVQSRGAVYAAMIAAAVGTAAVGASHSSSTPCYTSTTWPTATAAPSAAAQESVDAGRPVPTVIFDYALYPDLADNIWQAQHAGYPSQLHYNGGSPLNTDNREKALQEHKAMGVSSPAGYTRDEYPFATTFEGGEGAWVGMVPAPQQWAQGGILSRFYSVNRLRAFDPFNVVVTNHP